MQLLYSDRIVLSFLCSRRNAQRAIGSSRYKVETIDNKLKIYQPIKAKTNESNINATICGATPVDDPYSSDPDCDERIYCDLSVLSDKEKIAPRYYKLNKKAIKNKLNAFFGLKQSSLFLAFYSISFPCGMQDDDAYKCLNSWLTNCRTRYGLKSYLWVSERQKNGTIHFHLCTNNFMPIRKVNDAMGESIKNTGITLSDKGYNGVDVKRVTGDRSKLAAYITKYISKQDDQFNKYTRQCWRCSRDISALFTAYNMTCDEMSDVLTDLEQTESTNIKVYTNDFAEIILFRLPHPTRKGYQTIREDHYKTLKQINQYVYDTMQAQL